MGILNKIKTFCHIWDTKRFLRNIKFLIKNDLADIRVALPDEILEDCVFELDELRDYLISRTPVVLDRLESLTILGSRPKSFARFGDGEVSVMMGRDHIFQKYDPLLAEKMFQVLRSKRDDLYIGINRMYFHSVMLGSLTEGGRKFHRINDGFLRKFFMENTHPEVEYLDAGCFGGYFACGDNNLYAELTRMKRKLFEGRKIAVVTGKSVLDKLDYDIFELASSKIIIDAPSKDAFSAYDSILSEISRSVSKDTLICLILGQTATVMAADLTDMGYIAWDTGHIAKDYDFYMKNIEKTPKNQTAFFSAD